MQSHAFVNGSYILIFWVTIDSINWHGCMKQFKYAVQIYFWMDLAICNPVCIITDQKIPFCKVFCDVWPYFYISYIVLSDISDIHCWYIHYSEVIMGEMASQITSLTIVYSTVYSGTDQIKHQRSASLALVREIIGDRWNPRTKEQ